MKEGDGEGEEAEGEQDATGRWRRRLGALHPWRRQEAALEEQRGDVAGATRKGEEESRREEATAGARVAMTPIILDPRYKWEEEGEEGGREKLLQTES